MAKIVLAGGTGHLGKLLTDFLLGRGDDVVILSRKTILQQHPKLTYILWDGQHLGQWQHALEGAEVVINLSGESINRRFTAKNRKLLEDSRFLPSKAIGFALQQCLHPPRIWINFSGISIFGGTKGMHDEESNDYGTDYLAQLTQAWENIVHRFVLPNTQKVLLRVSPVLSEHWGMFSELLPLVKWRLGGKIGRGQQYISWIHEQDFVRLVDWIIQHPQPKALYHGCSPHPISNALFMKIFREEAKVPFGLPLPTWMAKIGALAKGVDASMLLQSVPATTIRTVNEGFVFEFADIRDALKDLITGLNR